MIILQQSEQCDRSFRGARSIDAGGGLSINWAPTLAPMHHKGVKFNPYRGVEEPIFLNVHFLAIQRFKKGC